MTAAHKLLPLGTKVRVTHLGNGRSIIVRINDRGPFVGDRVIDLSRAAATRLNIVGPGTGRVRIQSLGGVPQMRDDGDFTGAYYVQVGAFANKSNAARLTQTLAKAGHKSRMRYGSPTSLLRSSTPVLPQKSPRKHTILARAFLRQTAHGSARKRRSPRAGQGGNAPGTIRRPGP